MHDDLPLADHTVTLLGDGPADPEDVAEAYGFAPNIVAADGGARHAHNLGLPVREIVGDLDSLTNQELWRNSGTVLTQLNEQDSTDFEKCLATIAADLYLGVGFLGRRLDHSLACLRTLVFYPERPIILIGEADVVAHCPPSLRINVEIGTRVSLFPMAKVEGLSSEGLRWSIEGLNFAPDGKIGTSNEAIADEVEIQVSNPGLLILLPKPCLPALIAALAD